ncbi:MAG: hypothetical protein ACR2RB_00025, partial [Gammaproteobacteria bacterium]
RRGSAEGNVSRKPVADTQRSDQALSRLTGVREVAKRTRVFAVITQGRSRMREFRTYGSVRGAPREGRSYRD